MLAEVSNSWDMMERGQKCSPPAWSELDLQSDNSKLDCTGLKVDNLRNCWAYIAVFGLILKWKAMQDRKKKIFLLLLLEFL